MTEQITKLSEQHLHELHEALHFMKMDELRHVCQQYDLEEKGHKADIIHRIMTFVKTGVIEHVPVIPEISKAQRGKKYPLTATTQMLYGSYKNDAKARALFKKLIGDHFHFTAFGIDWLNERWIAGNPPTYAEFAKFWQQEYTRRHTEKVAPKKVWAYINFTQDFLQKHPNASREAIVQAWEKERLLMVEKVKKLLPD